MSDDQHPMTEGEDPSLDQTIREPEALESSRQIGPYRLLQRVGQGGMGEVWLAEQSEPIRRRVALKVIKRGMDSQQVVARFEAERQALALMSHPYVAKVFDAGTTPGGRPFFAMEYVPGVPITEYCTRHQMGLQGRLELFRKVCEGVQHAHQKAIIHRDLKPGNVLVMEQDGQPQPKIIDFGVAKATSQKLTEQTMFTQLGVLIGTPEYMSPEQAELTGEDVDTRTDVYSLGVILYELMCGALPFEPTELRKAGFDGIRAMIRDRVPQRPSVRASTVLTEPGASAEQWIPPDMPSRLAGDLDWITLKALEKDRSRRYATPADFARDIERHLANLPVEARPPTLSYRAGRFVRRNRVGVIFAAVIAALLLGSGTGLAILYARSVTAERLATQEAATAHEALGFMTSLFEAANPFNAGDEPLTVREVLDVGAERLADLDDQPEVQVKLMSTMADAYKELGDWETSRRMLEQAIETRIGIAGARDVVVADLQFSLAHNRNLAEDYDSARELLRQCLETRGELFGTVSRPYVEVLGQLAFSNVKSRRYAQAEEQARDALDILERAERDEEYEIVRADLLFFLGWGLAGQKKIDEAAPCFEECLAIRREHQGLENPAIGWTLSMYGWALVQHEDPDRIRKGIEVLEECYELQRRVFDGPHVEFAYTRINASIGYAALGDMETAEAYAAEAVSMASDFLDDTGYLGGMKIRRARYLVALGRTEEARTLLGDLLANLGSGPDPMGNREAARTLLEEIALPEG